MHKILFLMLGAAIVGPNVAAAMENDSRQGEQVNKLTVASHNSDSFIPTKNDEDIKPFIGRIVACISDELNYNRNIRVYEGGHYFGRINAFSGMVELIKIINIDGIPTTTALNKEWLATIGRNLEEKNMKMRLASIDELNIIEEDLKQQKTCFEWRHNPRDVQEDLKRVADQRACLLKCNI